MRRIYVAVLATIGILATTTMSASSQPSMTAKPASAVPNAATAGDRFQLVNADHMVDIGERGAQGKDLFKFDAQTGKTWIFLSGMKEGKAYRYWAPIGE